MTQAVMSCLLIVSWVIEVEYTLTAIPQLQWLKKKKKTTKKTEEAYKLYIYSPESELLLCLHKLGLDLDPRQQQRCCSEAE